MFTNLKTGEVVPSDATPEWYTAEVVQINDEEPTITFNMPGWETDDTIVVDGGFTCFLRDLPALHLQALAEIDALKEKIEEYEEEYDYEDENDE